MGLRNVALGLALALLSPSTFLAESVPEAWMINGTVVETMDAGIYTYLHVESDSKNVWVASSRLEIAVGDRVSVPEGVRMVDFYSTHLDRRFDVIYLVASVDVEGRKEALPSIPELHARSSEKGGFDFDLSDIHPAEGGLTVAAIFAQRSDLSDREIQVRGKVVKVTSGVLGRNWIHLRDGTAGPAGEDDLTVTTTEEVELGSVVLVRGIVRLDRDFGYGYRSDLLVEASSVATD